MQQHGWEQGEAGRVRGNAALATQPAELGRGSEEMGFPFPVNGKVLQPAQGYSLARGFSGWVSFCLNGSSCPIYHFMKKSQAENHYFWSTCGFHYLELASITKATLGGEDKNKAAHEPTPIPEPSVSPVPTNTP